MKTICWTLASLFCAEVFENTQEDTKLFPDLGKSQNLKTSKVWKMCVPRTLKTGILKRGSSKNLKLWNVTTLKNTARRMFAILES